MAKCRVINVGRNFIGILLILLSIQICQCVIVFQQPKGFGTSNTYLIQCRYNCPPHQASFPPQPPTPLPSPIRATITSHRLASLSAATMCPLPPLCSSVRRPATTQLPITSWCLSCRSTPLVWHLSTTTSSSQPKKCNPTLSFRTHVISN